MALPTDIEFAAKLALKQLLSPDQAKRCLALLDAHRPKHPNLTLETVILKKGFATEDQLRVFKRTEGMLSDDERFGPYVLHEKLGEGGMSTVYRATKDGAEESVALKILHPKLLGQKLAIERFRAEAKLLTGLDHQNVVRGFELDVCEGFPFLAMEYVDGVSILEHLQERRIFHEDAALYVIMQIAEALRYLQTEGIVHRDVKPGNILLTTENVVKLCDLGLAHHVGVEDSGDPETTVGTVHYISPEQAMGGGDVDVRSDIYSLGVTLYQMVVGELPFEGEDNQEVLAQRLLDSLSSSMVKSRSLSPHLHYFIHKMMAKERDIRYQSPAELIEDIRVQIRGKKTLEQPVEAGAVVLEKPFEEETKPAVPVVRRSTDRGGVDARKKRELRERIRIRQLKKKRGKR